MNYQTLQLFNCVTVKSKRKVKPQKGIIKQTLPYGFVFAPSIYANYKDIDLQELISQVIDIHGYTGDELNSSFHKSWNKVKTAPIEQLILEQALHYFTTYGFEALAIYDSDSVYIPAEKLEIPEYTENGLSIKVIHGLTLSEIKEKLINLLKSGIALKEDTLKAVVSLCIDFKLDTEDLGFIRNKEVRCQLYEVLSIIPKDPVEFLRLLVFKNNESSLLIKSEEVLSNIKEKGKGLYLIYTYKNRYGLQSLAEIFNRFKPLWLAMKVDKKSSAYINRIAKLSKKHHKPLPEDYLNNITAMIKRGDKIDKSMFYESLNKANTFRKVRLLYALHNNIVNNESVVYRIRNGKAWATKLKPHDKNHKFLSTRKAVADSIINDISEKIKGKKIYIPNNIVYALPTTEKQFIGNLPSGSYVKVKDDTIIGIHWNNLIGHRVDLDFAMLNAESKIGWDSVYRTMEGNILFSGDVTDANGENGASELFYIKKQTQDAYVFSINYFNYQDGHEVPFSLFVATEKATNMKANYIVNPNNILATAKTKINRKQKVMGLLVTTTNECRFYFSEFDIGKSITSGNSDYMQHAREYLFNSTKNSISLNYILESAGAKIIDNVGDADIDLSPHNISKDSILELLY